MDNTPLEKISVFQTFQRISQWHHSAEIPFSTVVPHKQIMEETAKYGITVEYRRIYLNCGKTVEKLLVYSVTWI